MVWGCAQKGGVLYKCFVWVWKFFVSLCGSLVRFFCKSRLSKAPIPGGVIVKVKSATAVTLRFTPGPESALNPCTYDIELCLEDDATTPPKTIHGPFQTFVKSSQKAARQQCSLRDLQPSSRYFVRVRAVNARGPSAYSAPVHFTTLCVPSADNGGIGALGLVSGIPGEYVWTQTDNEVGIVFELPKEIGAKRLDVRFKPRHICVRVNGSTDILLDGDICHAVKMDDCTWYRDSNRNAYVISLWKVVIGQQWDCAFKGHPRIDTKLINAGSKQPPRHRPPPGDIDMETLLQQMT